MEPHPSDCPGASVSTNSSHILCGSMRLLPYVLESVLASQAPCEVERDPAALLQGSALRDRSRRRASVNRTRSDGGRCYSDRPSPMRGGYGQSRFAVGNPLRPPASETSGPVRHGSDSCRASGPIVLRAGTPMRVGFKSPTRHGKRRRAWMR